MKCTYAWRRLQTLSDSRVHRFIHADERSRNQHVNHIRSHTQSGDEFAMAKLIEHSWAFDPRTCIGREINNIVLVELIGRGAMGAVFVGYQKSLKRKVAIKLYPKNPGDAGNVRIRFRDEAEIVSVLNHPNIVPVFDMGENGEFLFIAMQLVVGEDLRTMIHRHNLNPIPSRRQMGLGTALDILIPVIDALAFAHEEGVIHQDVKPGNILVEEKTKRPFVADFGIARSAMNNDSETDMIMGTPLYIAPEQIREDPLDERSDIYSVGIVLYETIAGSLPFKKTTVEALLNLKINNPGELFSKRPSEHCPAIDGKLEAIILKAVEPKKEDRFQKCRDFHYCLKKYYVDRFGERV